VFGHLMSYRGSNIQIVNIKVMTVMTEQVGKVSMGEYRLCFDLILTF